MVLRRGATVKGQVVGPDGQPIRDAWMISRIILDPRRGVWRSWTGRHHGNVRNGRFEIHGLDPDTEIPVYFLEPEAKAGRASSTSRASRRPAGRSPSGSNPAAPPRRGSSVPAASRSRDVYPVGAGPSRWSSPPAHPTPPRKTRPSLLSADEANLSTVDPVNYDDGAGLRCRRPHHAARPDPRRDLSLHRLHHVARGTDPELRKDFTVKPGETLDLGDILIENPR